MNVIATLICTVVFVVDGDTLDIQCPNILETQRVRLAVVDAPERGQPYFEASKTVLEALCLGQDATIHIYEEKDYYQSRVVATVDCQGINSGEYLLQNGLAWYSSYYGKKYSLEYLEAFEKQARIGQIQIWSDPKPIRPYDFRRGVR